MQGKTEAVSDFAKKKTMSQQRQYLPIFAVRQEVVYFKYCKIVSIKKKKKVSVYQGCITVLHSVWIQNGNCYNIEVASY